MTGIVLAAGQGTRMKSKAPKVIHRILDRPMVNWVVSALRKAGADRFSMTTSSQ
jgi:bifunctional UDP-N-acetylglucosamine pyrophosphorylase/glucosamine-1-phosphate N-acetyltransferase